MVADMDIRITEIGTMDSMGWLVIEEGQSRVTFRLSPEQIEKLANDAIFSLKRYARAKRELYGNMGKSLSDSTGDQPGDRTP